MNQLVLWQQGKKTEMWWARRKKLQQARKAAVKDEGLTEKKCEWGSAKRRKRRMYERGAVWAYAYLLARYALSVRKQKAASTKASFHRWSPRVFTYKTLYCQFGLFEMEPEMEISRTHTHVRQASEKETLSDKRHVHSAAFWTASLQAFVGYSWGQRGTLSDARLGICHFKAWVKRPLRLLIVLSSLITPGLCIAPFVTAATATSTLNLSRFDPP